MNEEDCAQLPFMAHPSSVWIALDYFSTKIEAVHLQPLSRRRSEHLDQNSALLRDALSFALAALLDSLLSRSDQIAPQSGFRSEAHDLGRNGTRSACRGETLGRCRGKLSGRA